MYLLHLRLTVVGRAATHIHTAALLMPQVEPACGVPDAMLPSCSACVSLLLYVSFWGLSLCGICLGGSQQLPCRQLALEGWMDGVAGAEEADGLVH